MNEFFDLPEEAMEVMRDNDMMFVAGGKKSKYSITVINEGHGCNIAGALNRGTGCGC